VVVHRIGGGQIDNLRLKPREETLDPAGFSVLLGGTPIQAADQMRQAFRDPAKFARLHRDAEVVGSATVEAIRSAGFDVIADPSARFPNHGRLTHPAGVAGFTPENLERLASVFVATPTPRT
jgi:hypothetical protein